ncbi:uncharacterized protein EDB91DRAFT_1021809, partial [Suillus paluster]|uniref:uncharacterized protein n=1 Tax=Suillus paluster TaxID=48578 RepID=UPI001B880CEF
MARILLGCLVGKVPRRVVLAYRSLLDFIYLAQYPTHNDHTLGYLQDALDTFHKHKSMLIELGIRDHFNIPKIHSLTHYINSIRMFGATDNYNTEAFECLHIDFAKDAWRVTNKRDEHPQMASWLDRYEKVLSFQLYLDSLGETPNSHETNPQPHISLPKRPHQYGQSLQNIMDAHHCPGLTPDLKTYLNQLRSRAIGEGLGQNRLEMTQLPFEKLDVYHGFKFVLEELGEDVVDGHGPNDWVRACPKTRGPHGQEQFDTVVVMRTDECEGTGLQGELILFTFLFKLPKQVYGAFASPEYWPTEPLAYIQWYTPLKPAPEKDHLMYQVKKMPLRNGNMAPANIIPLSSIRQT